MSNGCSSCFLVALFVVTPETLFYAVHSRLYTTSTDLLLLHSFFIYLLRWFVENELPTALFIIVVTPDQFYTEAGLKYATW